MRRSAIALACALVTQAPSARVIEQGDGGQFIPPSTGLTRAYRNSGGDSAEFWGGTPFDPYQAVNVTGNFPGAVLQWITGGGRDMGKWYCGNCVFTDITTSSQDGVIAFIASDVNRQQWGTVNGMWKPGDKVTTQHGFIQAPDLLGCRVLVRHEASGEAAYDAVVELYEVGTIDVQHISVNDAAFWSGERTGLYLLHHNKIAEEEGEMAPASGTRVRKARVTGA